MKKTLSLLSVFVIVSCVPRISGGEEFTRVTPKWAKDHPGRLEFSHGAAFDGSDGYTFRLLTDDRSRFDVLTRVSRQTAKGPRPVFETYARSNELSKSVVFNATVWPSDDLDVSFRVVQETPVVADGKITGFIPAYEYELRLEDFLNANGQLPTVDFKAIEREAKTAASKKP